MTALGIDIDLRTDFLEDHWGDECKCESAHIYVPVCSVGVTHRVVFGCGNASGRNLCALAAAEVVDFLTYGICDDCDKPAADCWRVIPA